MKRPANGTTNTATATAALRLTSLAIIASLLLAAALVIESSSLMTSNAWAASAKPTVIVENAATGKAAIKQGTSYKLAAKASFGTLAYKSSNSNVVTVNKKGTISGKKAGSATITITAKKAKAKATKKVKVTVLKKAKYKAVKTLKAKAPSTTLSVGKTTKITPTFNPTKASNKNVRYKSSDTKVLTVDANGKVTAEATGMAKVTVISCANTKAKASVTIKVSNPASDFEYAVGDYILGGTVRTGSVSSLNTSTEYSDDYGRYRTVTTVVQKYATLFKVHSETITLEDYGEPRWANGGQSAGGSEGDTSDCGHGVYITGYKGTGTVVVVPDKINGVPVVYASIDTNHQPSADYGPAYAYDFSQCDSLKYVQLWGHFSKIDFGSIKNVLGVDLLRTCCECALDFNTLTKLEKLGIYSGSSWKGLKFTSTCLRGLHVWAGSGMYINSASELEDLALGYCGIKSLNLGEMTKLKSLDLTHATGITPLDVSKNTLLESLDVSNTDITSLDVSPLTKLQTLDVGSTKLTSLDISKNPLLKYVTVKGCNMNASTMEKLLAWNAVDGHVLFYDATASSATSAAAADNGTDLRAADGL